MTTLDRRQFAATVLAAGAASLLPRAAQAQDLGPFMPHPGAQLTTAFTNSYGPDAESWIRMTNVTPDTIYIDYSSSRGLSAQRQQLVADRQMARVFVTGYSPKLPVVMPGTTTLGVSTAVLEDLRATGQAQIALVYDTAGSSMNGVMQLIERTRVPVILEGEQKMVPALHTRGSFGKGRVSATGEFFILENRNNPVMMQSNVQYAWEALPRTERVTAVTAGASERAKLEQALRTMRRYQTYGIHFNFDKATIRPDAAKLLNDIALTLKNNPLWTLQVVGHTDSIGDPGYNQRLSEARAQAVVLALGKRGIDPARLSYQGMGASNPIGDNRTLQGRALNRRVELVRTDR
jgi:outer membrane protein OmpA-like peptidoglycan-associated protein